MMRARQLLVLMVAVAALAAPAGAGAAKSVNVGVRDFEYLPGFVRVDPGDTVTWNVRPGQSHTMTTRRGGAPVAFDSGEKDPGQSFSFLFSTPGRYDYFCTIHPTLQSGIVQVGPDTVDPVVRGAKARRGSRSVRVSFRLSEVARVKAVVKRSGKAVKTIATKLLGKGSGSVVYKPRKLAPGSYRVVLTATDREGNASKAVRALFKVPQAGR